MAAPPLASAATTAGTTVGCVTGTLFTDIPGMERDEAGISSSASIAVASFVASVFSLSVLFFHVASAASAAADMAPRAVGTAIARDPPPTRLAFATCGAAARAPPAVLPAKARSQRTRIDRTERDEKASNLEVRYRLEIYFIWANTITQFPISNKIPPDLEKYDNFFKFINTDIKS